MAFRFPFEFSVPHPFLGMPTEEGGLFKFDGPCGKTLLAQASNGGGWEHVSVSRQGLKYVPNWEEMCFVKNLFWDEEDCVIQFHPPKSKNVDMAPVLHLWRKCNEDWETPPENFVGVK